MTATSTSTAPFQAPAIDLTALELCECVVERDEEDQDGLIGNVVYRGKYKGNDVYKNMYMRVR